MGHLTAAQNILLGREPRKAAGMLQDEDQLNRYTQALFEGEVDPISRTPYCPHRRSPKCLLPNRRIRRNFVGRWSNWCQVRARIGTAPLVYWHRTRRSGLR
jgi:hypothetical protein